MDVQHEVLRAWREITGCDEPWNLRYSASTHSRTVGAFCVYVGIAPDRDGWKAWHYRAGEIRAQVTGHATPAAAADALIAAAKGAP
jgi:hypothetical protein